jgi:DNA primase
VGTVILAEGYTDVIALHQAGLANAVGRWAPR